MDFLELVNKRHSTRGYLDKAVEHEKIDHCLEAVRLAPSACNAQPYKFIVVDEPGLRQKIAEETFGRIFSFNHFSIQAPVLIVIVQEKNAPFPKFADLVKDKDFRPIDIGIAAEHFCLAAAEQGLGTCMLGWFDEKDVKKLLGIKKNKRVPLIITLGYPRSDKIPDKKRKDIEKLRSYNSY